MTVPDVFTFKFPLFLFLFFPLTDSEFDIVQYSYPQEHIFTSLHTSEHAAYIQTRLYEDMESKLSLSLGRLPDRL